MSGFDCLFSRRQSDLVDLWWRRRQAVDSIAAQFENIDRFDSKEWRLFWHFSTISSNPPSLSYRLIDLFFIKSTVQGEIEIFLNKQDFTGID